MIYEIKLRIWKISRHFAKYIRLNVQFRIPKTPTEVKSTESGILEKMQQGRNLVCNKYTTVGDNCYLWKIHPSGYRTYCLPLYYVPGCLGDVGQISTIQAPSRTNLTLETMSIRKGLANWSKAPNRIPACVAMRVSHPRPIKGSRPWFLRSWLTTTIVVVALLLHGWEGWHRHITSSTADRRPFLSLCFSPFDIARG